MIYEVNSAPIYMLLNLANAESHNFTSEILLRNSSYSWDPSISSLKLSNWLISKGIKSSSLNISDGSGLSRNNLTTTETNYILH